jgi:hypothetical protein
LKTVNKRAYTILKDSFEMNDVEKEWYKSRLVHMFDSKCPLMFKFNHLVATCPTCGFGKYEGTSAKRRRIVNYPLGRTYTLFEYDIPSLIRFSKRYQFLMTNLEYPLPLIEYADAKHIPTLFDPVSKTVIDVFHNNSKRTHYILKTTDEEVSRNALNYVAYKDDTILYQRVRSENTIDEFANCLIKLAKELKHDTRRMDKAV